VALGLAVLGLAMSFLYSFFMDRQPEFDEFVLGNPIHMFGHSGRMTYPAHGFPEYMAVHPPTHYAIVATIMRTGLDMFHAAGVPVFALMVLTITLVLTGAFSFEVKIGLMFGVYLGLFVWGDYRPVRPDIHLAAAWLCGLIAMESGRLNQWKGWRLALGAFLVTYASCLHYPASLSFASAIVYAAWMVKSVGFSQARRRLLLMAAAGAVIGIPYVLQFVWPLREEIFGFVKLLRQTTWIPPWELHWQTYAYWWQHFESGPFHSWHLRPLTAALTAPLFALRVPAALAAPAVLLCFRTTRGIALAAAPHLAFLMFVAGGQGKNHTNTGYYIPEIALYLAAAITALLMLVRGIATRFGHRRPGVWSAAIAASVVVVIASLDVPASMASRSALTSRLMYEDLVRALGHQILGPGAAVASGSPTLWYHSGAEFYYFLTSDVLYPPDISGLDVPGYLARFDAVGISPTDAGITWNRQRKSPSEWYVDGLLKLRGFVLSEPLLSYLLTSTRPQGPVVGFCYSKETRQLWRFTEGSGGNAVLAVFTGPPAPISRAQFLNERRWGYMSFELAAPQPGTRGTEILQATLIPMERWADAQRELASFHVVQTIEGRVEAASVDATLRDFDTGRWPLLLPRSLPELEALRATTAGSPVRPGFTTLSDSARQNGRRLSSSGEHGAIAGRTDPLPVEPGTYYRVTFQLGIGAGGAAVNIMSPDLREYRYQFLRRYPQQLWPEAFVFQARDKSVIITVGEYDERRGRSRFELSDLQLEPVVLKP
jgi:hypothetical protein